MELIPRTAVRLAILVSPDASCVSILRYAHFFYLPSIHPFFHDGRLDFPANEYYRNDASMRELLGLRKVALVRLYTRAGLSDDFHALTKHELANAIISARDEVVDLPPHTKAGGTISLERPVTSDADFSHFHISRPPVETNQKPDPSHLSEVDSSFSKLRLQSLSSPSPMPLSPPDDEPPSPAIEKIASVTGLLPAAKHSNLGLR